MDRTDIQRNSLPHTPGVYLFKSKGNKNLYIGKAKNIKDRLQQYFTPRSLWKQDMVARAHHVERLPTQTEEEALILETSLIREHHPMYNNLIKGDQSYIYIKIPNEDYPAISLTRYKKNDGALYIGPKVWKKQLKQTLQVLRSILQYRTCTTGMFKKGHICSDYFFGLCAGRCAYKSIEQGKTEVIEKNKRAGFRQVWSIAESKQRYQEIITTIKKFFEGDTGALETRILSDIEDAIEKENFERAAKLRDVYTNLITTATTQEVFLKSQKSGVYVEVHSIDIRYVRVVIKVHRGKIIDVITGKEECAEHSIVDIYHMVEREYAITLKAQEEIQQEHTAMSFQPKLTHAERHHFHKQAAEYLGSYIQSQHFTRTDLSTTLLETLHIRYHLHTLPRRIECLDISHFGGVHTAGALSAMTDGVLDKTRYKRYHIRTTDTGDDYMAIEEVLRRRSRSSTSFPDLLVIDGGVGQLTIIKKLLQDQERASLMKNTTYIALGKGKARTRKGRKKGHQEYVSYFTDTQKIEVLPLRYDPADRLLIQIRDEAHRFANAYRKILMKKDLEAK